MAESHALDVALVARLPAVPTILKVISETTGLRLALVARVTDDQWTACAVRDSMGFGLHAGDHLDVATTLCREVRASSQPIVISHASNDPEYSNHPTPKQYRFESYVAVPIFRSDGSYFGNVCALDAEPRPVGEPKTVEMFRLFADLVARQLEAEERQETTDAALAAERRAADLREQFIAVLGHDLRNPLSSIAMGADLLAGGSLDDTQRKVLERIQRSTKRIHGLLDDVTDLARSRLGQGIQVDASAVTDLRAALEHVVDELRAAHPEHEIVVRGVDPGPVRGDRARLQQLLSNLLANALAHGDATRPVTVTIAGDERALEIAVKNHGPPIPSALRTRLFHPFVRGATGANGLGLGLYIVDQIVRAHGGTVTVSSDERETAFVCTLPR